MTENKTKATDASVDDYIASRASKQQYADYQTLMKLLKQVTRQPPKMWKACLYFKRLSDLDYPVLEQLVTNSVDEVKRRYNFC